MYMNHKIVKTEKGFRAFWEEGGGMTNTGNACIVAGTNGEKLEAIYIKKKGNLSCNQHALFLLKPNMWVVQIDRYHDRYTIQCFFYDGAEFTLELEPPEYLNTAIETAKEKSRHYHCRTPYYYLPKEELCESTIVDTLTSNPSEGENNA